MTQEQSKLTTAGMIVGTFQYMAPEQLEGKEADARTDIFAFGCRYFSISEAQLRRTDSGAALASSNRVATRNLCPSWLTS